MTTDPMKAPGATPETSRFRPRLYGLYLFLALVLVFGPGVVGNFVWDDVPLITANTYVRDISQIGTALTHDFWYSSARGEIADSLSRRYYRPVVTLAYAVQFQLFHEEPLGYHLVNLALHAACVLLAYGWLKRRLGGTAAVSAAAALGAGLFALHPSRPESVTWISGSTDLWMGFWVLAGLAAWDRRRDAIGIALAAPAFALAVFSKESAVVVPVLLVTDAVLLPAPREEKTARAKRASAVLLAAVLALGVRALVVPLRVPHGVHEGAVRALFRVASSLGYYLAQIVFPFPLSAQVGLFVYDRHGMPIYPIWSILLGSVVAAGFALLAWKAWRDERARPWFADALWFFVAVSPTLNIVPMHLNVLIAPRFLYVPMLGVSALLGRAVLHVSRKGKSYRLAAVSAGAALLGTMGLASLVHVGHFITEEDLWTHEYEVNPHNSFAAIELAKLSQRRGRTADVFRWIARGNAAAVRNGDGDEVAYIVFMGTTLALWTTPDADQATLLKVRRFFDEFVTGERGRAVLDTPMFHIDFVLVPGQRELRARLGFEPHRAYAYMRTQEFAAAERQLLALVHGNPRSTSSWRYLALVAAGEEQWDLALHAAGEARRLAPNDHDIADLPSVIEQDRALIARQPADDPVLHALARAKLYIDLEQYERTRRMLDPVIAAHPDRIEPVLLRARADVADRQYDSARAVLAAARARDPAHAAEYDRALAGIPASR